MQLKRLWDTDGKKIVFTEWPTWHQCQVWTDESGNLYIYDMAQWLAYNWTTPEGKEYDRSNWVALTDQTVWFYDTNEATDLYHWDHWDDAYYEFVDWDWTVLKSWTVIEWWTPTAPADPTRPSTAEYSYEFAWWEPAVWPITKKTTYTATYTATPLYTISFVINPSDWGTVDTQSLALPYWTKVWYSTVMASRKTWLGFGEIVGMNPEYWVKSTANAGYKFVNWTLNWEPVPSTVMDPSLLIEWDCTFVANFEPETYTVIVNSNNDSYGTVSPTTVSNVPYGTTVTTSSNTLTIGETTVTATAESGCSFVDWSNAPATITSSTTITANFQSDTPTPPAPTLLNNGELNSSTFNISFFNGTGNTWWIVFNIQSMEWTDNINAGWSAWLLTVLQDELDTYTGSETSEYITDTVWYFTATAWQYLEAVYENDSAANIAAAKNYIESVNGDVFTNTQPV